MAFRIEETSIAGELGFGAGDGPPLHARELRLAAGRRDGVLSEVRIELVVPFGEWRRVDAGAWFHLATDVRGPCFGGALDPSREVEIEAQLDPAGVARLAPLGDDVRALAEALRDDAALREPRRWYATAVKQQRAPGVKTGFATAWSAGLPTNHDSE